MHARTIAALSKCADQMLLSEKLEAKRGGLCSGTVGNILALSRANEVLHRADISSHCENLMDSCLDVMWHDEQSVSLLLGHGGYIWLFERLSNNGNFIFSNIEEISNQYDTLLLQRLLSSRPLTEYDLFYGETGIIHYLLLVKSTPLRDRLLTLALERISEAVEPFDSGLIIYTRMNSIFRINPALPEEGNLGHAHGISGTLAALAHVRISGRAGPEIDAMLDGLAHTIFSLMRPEADSCYGYTHVDASPSRVAWCSGDTCAANALHLAGVALDERRYIEAAKKIVDHVVNRPRNKFQTEDFGICHGLAGLLVVASEFYRRDRGESTLMCRDSFLFEILTAIESDLLVFDNRINRRGLDSSFLHGLGGVLMALSDEVFFNSPILPDLLAYFRPPAASRLAVDTV